MGASRGRRASLLLFVVFMIGAFSASDSRDLARNVYPHVPAVKTIQNQGDVIDCVWIYSQPAFSLPSLRSHRIQMRPTTYPAEGEAVGAAHHESARASFLEMEVDGTSGTLHQAWTKKGRCPQGTVPVARAPRDERLRTKPHGRGGSKYKYDNTGHEYAVMYQRGTFHGTRLNMNVWNPRVETKQMFSLGQLWVVNDLASSSELNTIEAGWHVYPEMFGGDNQTRLFIYWTRDGYQSTGCHNLYCAGFVQVSQTMAPGATISPVSAYQGTQNHVEFFVFKDPGSGNWWFRFSGEWVGYWPSSLFTTLASNASSLEWGGEVYNDMKTSPRTTTQMGSGHFPAEGREGTSCYFANIFYVDANNSLQFPTNVGTLTPSPGCYDIKVLGNTNTDRGFEFYFGGPGKNPACR